MYTQETHVNNNMNTVVSRSTRLRLKDVETKGDPSFKEMDCDEFDGIECFDDKIM